MTIKSSIQDMLFFNKPDENGYVPISVVSGVLGLQSQHVSRCFNTEFEDMGYPCLVDGLRVIVSQMNYHACKIHVDDIETFVNRWNETFNVNG